MTSRKAPASMVFTWNNYTNESLDLLHKLTTTGIALGGNGVCRADYVIAGKEVAPSTGTPHLQGFIRFKQRYRFDSIKRLFPGVHFEAMRGSKLQAVEYCKKENDFVEFGDASKVPMCQGNRSDMANFMKAVNDGFVTSLNQVIVDYPELYARCSGWCHAFLKLQGQPEKYEITLFPLKKWQSELQEILVGKPSDREIIFVVDFEGNSGKSWFCRYFYNQFPKTTQIVLPCARKDLSLIIKPDSKVLFYDVARSTMQKELLDYGFLEHVKDCLICSPKYHSDMINLKKKHIVIMMNYLPDMTVLSRDRYKIIEVNESNNKAITVAGNIHQLEEGDVSEEIMTQVLMEDESLNQSAENRETLTQVLNDSDEDREEMNVDIDVETSTVVEDYGEDGGVEEGDTRGSYVSNLESASASF